MNEPSAKRCCERFGQMGHYHCGTCGALLPSTIIALGDRLIQKGDVLMVIPQNFAVRCPSCGDTSVVRVDSKESARARRRRH